MDDVWKTFERLLLDNIWTCWVMCREGSLLISNTKILLDDFCTTCGQRLLDIVGQHFDMLGEGSLLIFNTKITFGRLLDNV